MPVVMRRDENLSLGVYCGSTKRNQNACWTLQVCVLAACDLILSSLEFDDFSNQVNGNVNVDNVAIMFAVQIFVQFLISMAIFIALSNTAFFFSGFFKTIFNEFRFNLCYLPIYMCLTCVWGTFRIVSSRTFHGLLHDCSRFWDNVKGKLNDASSFFELWNNSLYPFIYGFHKIGKIIISPIVNN